VTEINDYLRLLFARIGTTLCYSCGRVVERDAPEKIADFVLALPAETRLYICFPLQLEADEPAEKRRGRARTSARARATRLAMVLPGLEQQGFRRLLIGALPVELSGALAALEKAPQSEVHVVVDRLAVADDIRQRLVDSLEVCGREAEGRVEVV